MSIESLPEQERPAVAQARNKSSELMPRVSLRNRLRGPGPDLPNEESDALRLSQRVRIDTELASEVLVEREKPRRRARLRPPRLMQSTQLASEGVLEWDEWGAGNGHLLRVESAHRGLAVSRFISG